MFGHSDPIEKKLVAAKKRLKKAISALAPKHKGGEVEEFHSAQEEVLSLERELAKSKNEPYAVPCDFPIKWDVGAPLPILLCNDYKTFLTFYVSEPDPNWDGTYVKMVDPSSDEKASLCLVTFKHSVSSKMGHPNDEVQSGHFLAGKGLQGYTAQLVKNSPWLMEVGKTNSVHPYNDPEKWELLNHYIFWFHDSTFECLAASYEVENFHESMSELLERVKNRLIE